MAVQKSNQSGEVQHSLGYQIQKSVLILAGTFLIVWVLTYIGLKISTGL